MLDTPCLLRQKLIDPVREQPSCRHLVLVPSNEAAIASKKAEPAYYRWSGPRDTVEDYCPAFDLKILEELTIWLQQHDIAAIRKRLLIRIQTADEGVKLGVAIE